MIETESLLLKDAADIPGAQGRIAKPVPTEAGKGARRTWRPSLALVIGCLVALPVIVILAVAWPVLRKQVEADSAALSRLIAIQTAQAIEADLVLIREAMRAALSRDVSAVDPPDGPLRQIVRYPASQWRRDVAAEMTDGTGAGRLPSALDRARYGELAAQRADRIFFSPVHMDAGGAYLHIWKRLADGSLAVGVADADFVAAAIGDGDAAHHHHVAILDTAGQIVSIPAGAEWPGDVAGVEPIRLKTGEEVAVPAAGWRVIAWASPADLRRSLWASYRSVLVAGLAALACSVLLGFLLARRLMVPIHAAAERIARVDGSVAVRPYPDRVVGDIDPVLDLLDKAGSRVAAMKDGWDRRRSEADSHVRPRIARLASIGHDLRTPLNGVLGMIEAVRETEEDEDRRTLLDHAKKSAKALNRLVGDLLDYARLEQGGVTPNPRPVKLRGLAREVDRLVRPKAETQGVAFEITVDARMPQQVLLDPDRLKRILFILLSNALGFTEKGNVRVRLRWRQTAGEQACLEIGVADTGCGISEDLRPLVYEPFIRDPAGNSRPERGLGLGLSICRHLVQQMGGETRFTSIVGKGTEFTVTLPLDRMPSDTDAPYRNGEHG